MVLFMFGADNRTPAASPFGSRSRPLAGLSQAGFEQSLFESSQDSLINGSAFPGSSPALFYDKLKDHLMVVF
jgi:hypothetical protein